MDFYTSETTIDSLDKIIYDINLELLKKVHQKFLRDLDFEELKKILDGKTKKSYFIEPNLDK
tara:strand:+ start:402 stop:587 length:186 start_codon:yes stop_codon:yes gene_type:complete